ncbi:MAG: hypothetical protein JSW71_04745 [Gemmatimonadota bacterium]|nr:MAG: hypothetical protein JSW71_04745 [Gemmatimonadota bacterium]
MRPTAAVLTALAAACACTSAGGVLETDGVSDSAGTTIVNNHEPRWNDAEAWSVSFDPLVTIGVLDGSAEYQLYDVVAAARQSDGDIAVLDGGTRELRLYNRDGAFVTKLGGPGSGPGEFQKPVQVMVTPGDSLLVWDDALFRVTRFDPAGQLVDVRSVDRGRIAKAVEPPLYPSTGQLISNGDVLVRLIEKTGKVSPAGAARARSGALRVSADFASIDTLMFFGDIEQVVVSAPWGDWRVAPPRARTTVMAVQGREPRVCIGDQEVPEISCIVPDASRVSIRWTPRQEAVTDAEVTEWRDTTVAMLAPKLSEAEVVRVLDQVAIPAFRPPFAAIILDAAGNLWVEQGPAPGVDPKSPDYLVFDPAGVLLGPVSVPPMRVLDIGDDYLLGVHQDDLEVEYLQLFAIVKP